MMTLACAAIGPNGERCARGAGHPGQHVPIGKHSASPVQPAGLMAAGTGPTANAAIALPLAPLAIPAPRVVKAPKAADAAKRHAAPAPGAVVGEAAEGEADEPGAWTVPPEPIVRTDKAVLGLLLLALLYGLGSSIVTLAGRWSSAADAAAAAAHATGVTLAGRGDQTTKTFALDGDYLVRWSATPTTANGCYHAAVLERAGSGQQVELLVNEAIAGTAARSGTIQLAGLARNDYQVHATSDCAWSFAFEGR